MLGLSREQLLGSDPLDPGWRALYEDGSELPVVDRPAMRTLRSGRGLRGEAMGVKSASGAVRWLLVNTEPLLDAFGRPDGVVSCYADITEGRRLQDQLSRGARTDALTELPNRTVVQERVQRAIEHARRHPGYGFAVLFMDFDRFKQVNDTLGHGVGDELLRQIAQRLTDTLRPGDTVARVDSQRQTAARIGGDEFVVVLEGIRTAADVHVVAQRLLEALTQPYAIGPHHVQSSVSIGVVLSAQAGDSADAVLRDADTAMYEAKRAGRGRYVMFDPAMHERVVHALKLENDLRRALRERELFVVYQPVVDLRSGTVCGVEALVRWQHPQRGVVPPVEFIPVAEEAGLIAALGDFVLDAACRQYASWCASLGSATPGLLAVNLSRAQLMTPGLVQSVRTVLQQTGLRPSQLQLEVTESLAAQDEVVQNTLLELKALGVRLALDDFGTGYSSLACLHQMPVDTVKIDRSFLHQVEASGYHRVVIEATIRVAQTLGMTCVAEGVETEAQAALMRSLLCDRGQGYLFSRPLAAPDFERWLGQRDAVSDALRRAA
jgi:diguanylate cyclase (GGDEF)-like protein